MKHLLFMCLVLVSIISLAQEEKPNKSDYPLLKPEFVLDGRQTLVSTQGARLGGIRAGVEIR
ncbi:MAG: hypothetical protein FJX90_06550, partial [Bacteroidetes bacterium]|nr:hypothetical protein [Bacteroidota bacterium]